MFGHPGKRTLIALTLASMAITAQADSFNRIATFANIDNLPSGKAITTETSAEIITATLDGNTLVYSDSPLGGIGFIDLSNATAPKPGGFVSVNGEPTSVAVTRTSVLAGVNTSESYLKPSGKLVALTINDQKITESCDLGGQPDSVAVSKDEKYVAIAIENERDEDLDDGALPQLPAGYLTIIPLVNGSPICSKMNKVDMTGIAAIGGDDPEPEFVDFNDNNEIVVTLQENNHIAIIAAETGKIINHFSAGSAELHMIDTKKDKALDFSQSQTRLREPDSVKWIDNDRFVTANEGDYQGGARGFTIFHKNGEVIYESGSDFEHKVIATGHYPDKRSSKKGNEPEGVAVGKFGTETYLFILSERASVIGVYRDTGAVPEFIQMLPSGIAPESAVTIPSRNLLISANEKDLIEDKGPRAHVMVYELSNQTPAYPQIMSQADDTGVPIGWGALSGLTADLKTPGKLFAVNDSFYANQPTIFSIDATQKPALITNALPITRNGKPAGKLDLEGISIDGTKGFWLASEGKAKKGIPHAILHVNTNGEIDGTINFPDTFLAHQKRFGAEGITQVGDTLWIAMQREWSDDPKGLVKLIAYNLKTKEWRAAHYPLDKSNTGWVGLSEITAYNDALYIIERDNQLGKNAKTKQLTRIHLPSLLTAPLGEPLPIVSKEIVRDFIPDLKSLNGYVTDKIEGFAVDVNGTAFAITDNDGVDDSSGETLFFSINSL